MKIGDTLGFAFRSLRGYPLRTGLMLLAMAIGVASVVLLTALGEGARRYVTQEFTSLGTHLLIVLPGRSETTGGPPPLLGETPRDLTLEDASGLDFEVTPQYTVEVTVTDNGPGIAPGMLEKMFNPFQTSKESGMGMGLSISRSIIAIIPAM